MVTAIIAAAGQGRRMGHGINKVFISLNRRPLLSYTIEVFEKCEAIDEIIIVTGEEDILRLQALVDANGYGKVRLIVAGGMERQQSIDNALQRLSPGTRWVVVHDGARPFVSVEMIAKAVEEARRWGAAGIAVPVKDTVKIADDDGFIKQTPDRNRLWAMQTPQAFARDILERAYRQGDESGLSATDDAALVEALGVKVKLIIGEYTNIKITTPEDLLFAAAILGRMDCENRDGV